MYITAYDTASKQIQEIDIGGGGNSGRCTFGYHVSLVARFSCGEEAVANFARPVRVFRLNRCEHIVPTVYSLGTLV